MSQIEIIDQHTTISVGEMIQYMEDWVTDEYMVLPIVQLSGDLDVPINFHAGGAEHVEGVMHLAESYPRTRALLLMPNRQMTLRPPARINGTTSRSSAQWPAAADGSLRPTRRCPSG